MDSIIIRSFSKPVLLALATKGYVVIAAVEDGETAMQLLQEGLDINMLLPDLSMGTVDGLELTCRSIQDGVI